LRCLDEPLIAAVRENGDLSPRSRDAVSKLKIALTEKLQDRSVIKLMKRIEADCIKAVERQFLSVVEPKRDVDWFDQAQVEERLDESIHLLDPSLEESDRSLNAPQRFFRLAIPVKHRFASVIANTRIIEVHGDIFARGEKALSLKF